MFRSWRSNNTGEQFGDERLAATLAAHQFLTAAGAVAAVHAAVEDHLHGSRHGVDDLAVLALRC